MFFQTWETISYFVHNSGQFKVDSQSLVWVQTHGIFLEIPVYQIKDITWTQQNPTTNQLGVLAKDGVNNRFSGFSDEDISSLIRILKNKCNITVEEKQLSVAGKNWGTVDISGDVLSLADGPKQLFEVPLANVVETDIIKRKDDVVLKFDTSTSSHQEDSLFEMILHVPSQFVGSGSGSGSGSAAEELKKNIESVMAAVVTFHDVTVLSPRGGQYVVELHRSFIMVQGDANGFKVDYRLISDVFMLPKDDSSHTYVVISLHTAIGKGRSSYSHIVFQFDAPGCKMGCIVDGFTGIVCGLSGTELTKSAMFFRSQKGGLAVETLLEDESGLLYPLQDCFLFLPAPPTCIFYDKIDYVRFGKHEPEGLNRDYFDVLVRLKTKQEEHLFRRIKRDEFLDFRRFITARGINIMKLGGGKQKAT